MNKLLNELNETESELKAVETDYENTMKTINALKVGIQSIFDKIKIGAAGNNGTT